MNKTVRIYITEQLGTKFSTLFINGTMTHKLFVRISVKEILHKLKRNKGIGATVYLDNTNKTRVDALINDYVRMVDNHTIGGL